MLRNSGHSDVDQVRLATDLVALVGEHVALKSRGREHVGLCPFHDDHKPSLAVVTHKGSAFYKCHSCGAAGDCFDFVMQFHKMDFAEALRHLAGRAGVQLRAKPGGLSDAKEESTSAAALRRANALAADFFRAALVHPQAGAVARGILQQRGINQAMIDAFGLGYAPDAWDGLIKAAGRQGIAADTLCAAGLAKPRSSGEGCYDAFRNRITFTISDALGHAIAFGARQINPEDEPKYLNSAESAVFHKSATLFGLHQAKRAIVDSGKAVVTEGYTDVIACHQAGIRNVVATLGTALTREHATILKRLGEQVVLLFDGDEAGLRAADRALEIFFDQSLDLRIAVVPDGRDPDDVLRQPGGGAVLEQVIGRAIDALAYKTGRFMAHLRQAETATARANRLEKFLDELCELGIGGVQGPRRRLVCMQLADALALPLSELESALAAAHSRRPRRATSTAAAGTVRPASSGAGQDSLSPGHTDEVVPRARTLAERELLALVMSTPELLMHPVVGLDGQSTPLATSLDAVGFLDGHCRAIFRILVNLAATRSDWTAHHLIDAIEDAPSRQVAASLYLNGMRQLEDDASMATEHVVSAHAALCQLILSEQFLREATAIRQQPESVQPALVDLVERRRRVGSRPAAIPIGVRS